MSHTTDTGVSRAVLAFDACRADPCRTLNDRWRAFLEGQLTTPVLCHTNVEALALDALAADSQQDSLTAARKAFQQARLGEDPNDRFLANLVLARVRRRANRPHLALHILSALDSIVSLIWRPWLAWEFVLTGAEELAQKNLDAVAGCDDCNTWPSTQATLALLTALQSARAGDRQAVDACETQLRKILASARPMQIEALAALALIDGTRDTDDNAVAAFRSGAIWEIPHGLAGIALADPNAYLSGTLAHVVGLPATAGYRALDLGRGLTSSIASLARQPASDAGGPRTETALCVLALAGPEGLSREDFFCQVYGFAFVGLRHQALLDVLAGRMRDHLGTKGHVDRAAGGKMSLALKEPLMITDHRCALAPAELVLRALSKIRIGTAEDAARALDMPLRSVHRLLRDLIEDGAVEPRREGRRIVYRIEDTTFTALTTAPKGH